jgi:outer membrane protein assembly factor BamB
LAVAFATSVAAASPAQVTYAPTPRPTWAANNTVYAVAVHGNTVYLGGEFSALKNPATGATVFARGLAALDRTTGQPLWTAHASGEVRSLAVAADGTRAFAGGAFIGTWLRSRPAPYATTPQHEGQS